MWVCNTGISSCYSLPADQLGYCHSFPVGNEMTCSWLSETGGGCAVSNTGNLWRVLSFPAAGGVWDNRHSERTGEQAGKGLDSRVLKVEAVQFHSVSDNQLCGNSLSNRSGAERTYLPDQPAGFKEHNDTSVSESQLHACINKWFSVLWCACSLSSFFVFHLYELRLTILLSHINYIGGLQQVDNHLIQSGSWNASATILLL